MELYTVRIVIKIETVKLYIKFDIFSIEYI